MPMDHEEQVLDNEYVTISLDGGHQLITVVWKRHCEDGKYRQIMAEALRYVNTGHLTKWLCDMRHLQYLLLADQNWFTGSLLPSVLGAGKHRLAHLISVSDFELMASLHMQEAVRENPDLRDRFEMEVFLSKDLALEWLG